MEYKISLIYLYLNASKLLAYIRAVYQYLDTNKLMKFYIPYYVEATINVTCNEYNDYKIIIMIMFCALKSGQESDKVIIICDT